MEHSKIPVYLMPGMATSSNIFDNLVLLPEIFDVNFLEWSIPEKNISLEEYAKLMCKHIRHENPVLIGVSLGGLLVQEMSRIIKTRKVIIISSVKSEKELPAKMHFARVTKVHKLLPTGMVNNIELLAKYAFGEAVTKRLDLYEKYLSVRDKGYIDWSVDRVVNWKQRGTISNLVHIHGDKDPVFPIRNISNCITVKNGTHTMIIHRFRWFNEHLPKIILENDSSI
ncbi:alpha/beta hydrolase [Cellulophaga baltica]|uniref:alpha/beta fold hydrolase n=1 Tax=Cellulophaga TaxID=104264 RepID=UPI001C06F189|nr:MULTISPECIES: alpha/beta hydrolase [Cellulophaga]MBU2997397.1 alpha/beta hydrolase [Cellulophaga baltica]MDO6768794.1 alpha/beta hydrolase [Cellulophaga sp. 1_MG-2023]